MNPRPVSLLILGLIAWLFLTACWSLSADGAPHDSSPHETAVAASDLEVPASPVGGKDDSLARVLLGVTIILFFAKVAGHLAIRIGLPSVLGELLIGVVLGNLTLIGIHRLEFLPWDPVLEGMAQLGAIILLFTIGLKSDMRSLAKVGLSSTFVALLGVIAPLILGVGLSHFFYPEAHPAVHLFVGAALCATSVGITARVFEDAGRVDSPEARIILGAAVIDDLLALVLLALVTGMVGATNGEGLFGVHALGSILFKVGGFLVVSAICSLFLSRRLFTLASHLRGRNLLLVTALVFCMSLAWIAEGLGLAPIVGAFFAGLALDDATYHDFVDHGETRQLEDLVEPIEAFLVPVFFVMMGLHVDLLALASLEILQFAFALTFVALIGKQLCGLGVVEPGASRLAIGIGMVPRGEVGLVFAGVGASLMIDGQPVIGPAVYGAFVLMVFVTTLITPPLIIAALPRRSGAVSSDA